MSFENTSPAHMEVAQRLHRAAWPDQLWHELLDGQKMHYLRMAEEVINPSNGEPKPGQLMHAAYARAARFTNSTTKPVPFHLLNHDTQVRWAKAEELFRRTVKAEELFRGTVKDEAAKPVEEPLKGRAVEPDPELPLPKPLTLGQALRLKRGNRRMIDVVPLSGLAMSIQSVVERDLPISERTARRVRAWIAKDETKA